MSNVWTIKRIRNEVQNVLKLSNIKVLTAQLSQDVIIEFSSTMNLFNIQSVVKQRKDPVSKPNII